MVPSTLRVSPYKTKILQNQKFLKPKYSNDKKKHCSQKHVEIVVMRESERHL